MKTVICNKCAHEFKIKKIKKKLVQDGLEGKVTINYFTCPKCLEKYTSFVENEELRNLIKEKTKIYSGIGQLKDPEKIEAAFKRFEELEKKAKGILNRLKLKFKA